jgi:hypothetical protein
MRKVLFFATVFAFVLTSSVWAADVSGTWTLTMKSPQGQDETFNLDIKSAGENLTITCSDHPVLQNLEGKGTLKGNAIEMNLKSTGGQMAGVGINFTGKVTGNKMAGTREIDTSGMGSGGGGRQGGDAGGATGGEGQAAQGRQGGAPSGGGAAGGDAGGAARGGAPGGGGEDSDAWTAVKK